MQQFLDKLLQALCSGCSQLTPPLFDLTRKNLPVTWEDCCAGAFAGLKQALTTAPVSVLPDTKLPYELLND